MTKSEVVEYSCSEDETETIVAEPIKTVQDVSSHGEGSEKTPKKKKISPPKATNSKQGSILSFFSKK